MLCKIVENKLIFAQSAENKFNCYLFLNKFTIIIIAENKLNSLFIISTKKIVYS